MIIKLTNTLVATQVNQTLSEISLNPEKGHGGILWYLDCIKNGAKCHELAVITNENQVAEYICLNSERHYHKLSIDALEAIAEKLSDSNEYLLIRIVDKYK